MSEISNKFFADKAVGALWDIAVSIKRGNPLPLDKDAVVHGMAELEALKTGAVTYPGQIVAVIEDAVMEEGAVVSPETTTLYYFDHELNYHEVGKVPVGDELSVEVNNEVISLHNFGRVYYEYVPEVKDDEGNITSEAKYEKVEVSTEKPWKAGLEPKVVVEDGKMVLGWYEPNPTTIDGVNSQIAALQASKADVIYVDDNFAKKATTLEGYGITNAYTKAEVEGLVNSAGHLKRVTVETLPAVSEANEDTIYMLKKASNSQLIGDYYEEYLLIDGAFELIGNTYVDLSDYATTEYVDGKIGVPADGDNPSTGLYAELDKKATTEALTNGLADKVTTTGLETALSSYAKTDNVNTELGKKIESITINGEALPAEDKAVALPGATADKMGLVKGSSAENQITVATDGIMSVNSVNVNKLVQTEGEVLILNGGSASD